ncbi:MAG: GumC family protein [Parvularculaceae bacterium]
MNEPRLAARNDWSDGAQLDRMSLLDLLSIFKRRKFLFSFFFVTIAAASTLYATIAEPKFASRSIVLVNTYSDDEEAPANRPTAADELVISTMTELMKSRRVAEKLALHMSDELAREAARDARPILPFIEKSHVWVASIFDREEGAEPTVEGERRLREATDKVIARTEVTRIKNSRLVQVGAVAERPEKAAAMANALVEVFLTMRQEDRQRARQKQVERLRAQAQQAQVDLYDADLAIANYMRENDLIAANGAAAVENRVARLETALSSAKAESVSRRLNQLLADEKIMVQRLNELSIIYGSGYPEIVDLRAQLEALRIEISAERDRLRAANRSRRAEIDQNAAALSNELRSVRREHFKALEANAGLKELEREASARQSIFKNLSDRLRRAENELNRDVNDVSFVSRAVAPTDAASASTAKIVAVGSFGGLLVAAFMAMVAESMDRSVRSSDQVRLLLGAPTLAMIPRVKSRKFGPRHLRGYIQNNQTSDFYEATRNLFLELISRDVPHRPRLVVMTSVTAEDGKSTIANALSEMASMFDCRAVVVGLDRNNNLKPVTANADIDDEDARSVTAAVTEMSAGGDVAMFNDGASLTSFNDGGVSLRSLPRQLEELGERWDLIIVEAPPVLRSRDAKALAAYASDILVVMEWGRVRPGALRAVREVFDDIKVGAVMNRVNLKAHAERAYGDAIQFSMRRRRRLFG